MAGTKEEKEERVANLNKILNANKKIVYPNMTYDINGYDREGKKEIKGLIDMKLGSKDALKMYQSILTSLADELQSAVNNTDVDKSNKLIDIIINVLNELDNEFKDQKKKENQLKGIKFDLLEKIVVLTTQSPELTVLLTQNKVLAQHKEAISALTSDHTEGLLKNETKDLKEMINKATNSDISSPSFRRIDLESAVTNYLIPPLHRSKNYSPTMGQKIMANIVSLVNIKEQIENCTRIINKKNESPTPDSFTNIQQRIEELQKLTQEYHVKYEKLNNNISLMDKICDEQKPKNYDLRNLKKSEDHQFYVFNKACEKIKEVSFSLDNPEQIQQKLLQAQEVARSAEISAQTRAAAAVPINREAQSNFKNSVNAERSTAQVNQTTQQSTPNENVTNLAAKIIAEYKKPLIPAKFSSEAVIKAIAKQINNGAITPTEGREIVKLVKNQAESLNSGDKIVISEKQLARLDRITSAVANLEQSNRATPK